MRGSATALGVREVVMRAERAKTARSAVGVHDRRQGAGLCQLQRPTRACRRRETASARASLRLFPAPEA
jgi:hypothetical protein